MMKKVTILLLLMTCFEFVEAQDWPNLKRYQAANEQLKDSVVNVVYMGDSITDSWVGSSPDFFLVNKYADRGISGQTSPQMLLRFRQDVIALKPKVVVILCGTNDIAGNTGPSTLEMIEDNIQSMCDLAKANKIKVILCSVLPSNQFGWKPEVQPADSIVMLNAWIKGYAKAMHYAYADYFALMVDDKKGLKKEYASDSVHPNKDGYRMMEKIIQSIIKKAL